MAYPDLVIADGASHYWRLSELSGTTTADRIGTATGTITGGVTLGAAGALTDGSTAMLFNGSSGQVALGTAAPVPVVATIEGFIQVRTPPAGYAALFSSRSTGSGVLGDLTVGLTPAMLLACYPNPGSAWQVFGTTPLALGARYHVAYVLDGVTARIYLNGVLDNSGAFPRTAVSAAPGYLATDKNNTTGQYWWSGILDEVALYPKALTAAQIQAHVAAAQVLWPAKTWAPREFVTSQMLNDIRDELNELHARISVDILSYVDIPFAASNFFYPSSASWTVTSAQVAFNRYWRLGNTVIWTLQLANTTVGGTTAPYLYMVPPLPVALRQYNVRTTYDMTVGSSHNNAWTWVDPNSGCVLFQAPSGYAVGTFTVLCTMIYETTAP